MEMGTIELSEEVHTIYDEYIGYGYVVNKAFKPAKSHAVEEYKESQTFEGAVSVEPLEGRFLFRAKRDCHGDMMYFYGFELEGDEYWDKAGLCLVYSPNMLGQKRKRS